MTVLKYIVALATVALLTGCNGSKVDPIFVTAGDPFFDDAVRRLSQPEQLRLGFQGPDDIMGFYFEGRKKACIVLLPRKRNVILHGPESVFCYDKTTSNYIGRM